MVTPRAGGWGAGGREVTANGYGVGVFLGRFLKSSKFECGDGRTGENIIFKTTE